MSNRIQFPVKKLSLVFLMTLLLAASQLSYHLGKASASGNLALARYTWASSGASPSSAVDGSQNTYWQLFGEASGWITVDLGSVKSVNQIVLKSPAYGHWVESVTVLTSNSTSDSSFTAQTFGTYAFYYANHYTITINLPSTVSTRYVRVNVGEVSGGGTATTIGELEVYGP